MRSSWKACTSISPRIGTLNTPSRVSVLDCGCPSAALALGAKDVRSLRPELRAGTSVRKASEGQAQFKTSRTFERFTESLDFFLTRSGTMNTPWRASVLDCGCPSAALALGAKDVQSLRPELRAGTSERKAPEGQAQSKTSRTFGWFTESLDVFLTRSGTTNTPWRVSVLDCGCPSGILCLGRWRYRART